MQVISQTPTGHIYGEWETVTPETCTTNGRADRFCSVCSNAQTQIVSATGHTLGDWLYDNSNHWHICLVCQVETDRGEHTLNEQNVCTGCGYERGETLGLAYTLSAGGDYYTVSGIGTAKDTDIVVPSNYQGLPVKEIGEKAFSNYYNLTSIIIPSSVTSIGNNALSSCYNLKNVIMRKGVTSLGEYAFRYCDKLTSITIPDSVTSIGQYTFGNCTGLTSIVIPDSVTSLGNDVFSGCSSLSSVTIGKGVTNIKFGTFFACSSLTSITIPDTVTIIDYWVFRNCTWLKSITIGSGVTKIDWGVLDSCSSLTDITYNGTKAQWQAIEKASSWNSNTDNFTIHCTDGDLDKNGNEITA